MTYFVGARIITIIPVIIIIIIIITIICGITCFFFSQLDMEERLLTIFGINSLFWFYNIHTGSSLSVVEE